MMRPDRFWLDWNRPCLPQAAVWLLDASARDSEADFSGWTCAVPGRQAGRQLLRRLVEEAARRSLTLTPPRIVTPGALTRALADQAFSEASEVECRLAWRLAFDRAGDSALNVLIHEPPADEAAWNRLAALPARLRRDLQLEDRRFRDAGLLCERFGSADAAERWKALEAIEGQYIEVLAEHDLLDPDDAERTLIEEARTSCRRLVLIAVPELGRRMRRAIEAMAPRVDVLVYADESLAASFDDFGAVLAESWIRRNIDLADDQIISVENQPQLAQAVADEIGELNGRYATDEILIGLGDEESARTIAIAGAWADLPMRASAGTGIERTAPFLLLQLMADWLQEPRFGAFAALIRHPDLQAWLATRSTSAASAAWEDLLDRYFADHLQLRLSGKWLGDEKTQAALAEVWHAVDDLLRPLGESDSAAERAGALGRVLATIYRAVPTDPLTDEALDVVAEAIESVARSRIQPQMARGGDWILSLITSLIAGSTVNLPDEGEIRLAGWLELALDDAPILILTGLNEGSVPASVEGDAFLPDSLRAELGLPDDRRRHGRDAYLFQAMLRCRKFVRCIVPRQDARGTPRAPSRLLMHCPIERIAARVRRLVVPRAAPPVTTHGLIAAGESRDRIPPLPADLPLPTSMRVTDFRLYLACPYRYALQRLMGLDACDDSVAEMSPTCFGSLLHNVLEQFGNDESIRRADNAARIEAYLLAALDDLAGPRFGEHPAPAVRVQLARLQQRLRAFAIRQASLVREGWRIVASEHRLPIDAALSLPGEDPMPIRGTIDRIDQFRNEQRYRLIDYKSGDRGESPYVAHHGCKSPRNEQWRTWTDLQLPLYHHFAGALGYEGVVEVGYFLLPRSAGAVDFVAAEWTPEHLRHAIDVAVEVVQSIRARRFDPATAHFAPSDPFARILRTTVWQAEPGEVE